MFATIVEVEEIAGVTVDEPAIKKAQAIVETAAGRPEEVIMDATDLIWLKKATAYQCAYMAEDPTSVFEQPNLESVTQGENKMVFGDKAVWLSPVAQKALGNLSWRRSRLVPLRPFNYRKELWRQDVETVRMRGRWWSW
ncbi:hypothetical protein OG787_36420 [Streptomyces sp. NBC_00075]|uniref:hypothetical protein n=1 Tax=Streptomyces sp. NBC_00075 TaxID=2975641 RepID=UPI0032467FE2